MHARELVELAAMTAWHGPALVIGAERLSASGIEQYWAASRCRLDRWSRSIKTFASPAGDASPHPARRWALVRPVLEEVLASELLTRVWTAVVVAHDRRRGLHEAEPVVRSILLSHLEMRHRAMSLLVDGPGVVTEEAVALNRLRRRAERWIDLLLAHLATVGHMHEFCVDSQRMSEFAEDVQYQQRQSGGRQAWPLTLVSLRAAFQQGFSDATPNADTNAQIAESVLACFPSELFDGTGVFRALWSVRMMNATNDAQGMIDELLDTDGARAVSARRDDSSEGRPARKRF